MKEPLVDALQMEPGHKKREWAVGGCEEGLGSWRELARLAHVTAVRKLANLVAIIKVDQTDSTLVRQVRQVL